MRAQRRSALEQRLELSYWLRNGPRAARKAARIFSGVELVTPRPKRSRPENSKLAPYRSEGRGEGEGQ
jgi:hypothetical protein